MTTLLPGHASETAAFARRHGGAAPCAASTSPRAGAFRVWNGVTLSTVGMGTYLGKDDEATDRAYAEAVRGALERGINVIDTAINYRSQRSERALGAALRSAVAADRRWLREEIFVASKAGFLPFDGSRPPNARAYFEETYVRRGILAWDDVIAGCHCLAPRYLLDQLDRSRANLGLDTIDLYYLHNPEMQLDELARPEFLRRVRTAFAALEGAVAAGKIRWYGTATWHGYRLPAANPGHLSLVELLALAEEVGGPGHHFRFVQLPFNVAMPEAATVANQSTAPGAASRAPILEVAAAAGMYVMTSASILQGKLARDLPAGARALAAGLRTDAQRALQLTRSAPGVGTALVGMKTLEHVEENAAILQEPPADPAAVRALLG